MKIFMHINIGHNTAAVWIILQIIKNTVYLIHHAFFVLMLHTQLITIRFSNGAILVSPAIPDMAVKVMDVV